MPEESKTKYTKLEVAMKAKIPTFYWGNWLIENTIATLTGTGGVSKTSMVYDLLLSLIEQGEYFGVKGKSPKVLYFDVESNDSLIHTRLRLLGKEKLALATPSFLYVNDPEMTIGKFALEYEQFIKEYFKPDIIVLDPVSLVCPVFGESDNDTVSAKMKWLRDLTVKWHVIFFLVFHPAKEGRPGDNVTYIRGAGAWANLADVCMNLYRIEEKYGSNLAILEIPKNRWVNDGFKQCLKLEEGEFSPVEFPENYLIEQRSAGVGGLKTFKLMEAIDNSFDDELPHSRREIWEKIGIDAKDEVMFHRAMTALFQKGKWAKISRGVYKKLKQT